MTIGVRNADTDAKTCNVALEYAARRQHGLLRAQPGVHRPLVLAGLAGLGMTRPSLPALGGLFLPISKRDPASSFNRNFHIDGSQLTWSYGCLPIGPIGRWPRQAMIVCRPRLDLDKSNGCQSSAQ
ncbi:MAG TPA: hypothetical protein VJR71_14780 [Pseudolabrys sp.]|nr:hypothetical protein [Pseudolabrys sp.]